MHHFFRVVLPQLAAAFEEHSIKLEIDLQKGGQLFFSEEIDDEEHNEMVDNHFKSDYWELLAPTLTSLTLEFQGSAEISQERLQPLLFLHNLQSLELTGGTGGMYIHLPAQLSLPALRRLSLYEFANIAPFHVDCRALQELHYWDYMSDHLPTGLTECSITVLDIGVPYWGAQAPSRADSFATIEGLRASLEVLDISGHGLRPLIGLPNLRLLSFEPRAPDNEVLYVEDDFEAYEDSAIM
ncbi:hypothetical protein WJX75_004468 [Coccomyxa subellipsoidea]|uniref:RNI-like protein n=1 Tax=Coccomyxa subellipsoidea TaxID=248742 RepID=A0ABR2YJ98_9CHLO